MNVSDQYRYPSFALTWVPVILPEHAAFPVQHTQDIMRYERFLLIMKYTRPNKISLRVRRKFYRVNEEGNQL